MMNKPLATLVLVMSAVVSSHATADALLVDRGLPTTNLNLNTADRSNVAWVDGGQTIANPSPNDHWVEGDTFTNNSGTSWTISTIRIWTVGNTGTVSLLGGLSSAGIAGMSTLSNTYTAMPGQTYAGGAMYMNTSGSTSLLTQVDFSVNITLGAGQQFTYFLDGTGGNYVVPFMSASNAALSGSPQDDADDMIWEAQLVGGSFQTMDSFSTLGNGWDKGSDFNVQVFGTAAAIPEPGSIALVSIALLGLAAARRRKV